MSGVHDWLRVLELEPGASFDDVRRAHRDMAKVWHPDRFANDARLREKAELHQKAINEAFGNLEKWVKSGQLLPGQTPPGVEVVAHAGMNPAVHKRHPLRDTWTIRQPLGYDRGVKRGPRRRRRRSKIRWIAAAFLVLSVVVALVVGMML